MGRGLVERTLDANLLSRPPLFGAATAPLWLFQGGLPPFQLMSVVASAAPVTVMFGLLRKLRPNASLLFLVPFLISPVFLHHNAAPLGEAMMAGLLIASAFEASDQCLWRGAFFFSLAVATHDRGIIFAPLWILAAIQGRNRARGVTKALGVLALTGAVVVAPIQVWEVVRFGQAMPGMMDIHVLAVDSSDPRT